ncbi:MAG: hypothetical protein ABJN65_06325 [Parasphingorhabdus sp.]
MGPTVGFCFAVLGGHQIITEDALLKAGPMLAPMKTMAEKMAANAAVAEF